MKLTLESHDSRHVRAHFRGVKLSRSRAFLIQLSEETDRSAKLPTGRVEHVESGERARFVGRDELWAFVEKVHARVSDAENDG